MSIKFDLSGEVYIEQMRKRYEGLDFVHDGKVVGKVANVRIEEGSVRADIVGLPPSLPVTLEDKRKVSMVDMKMATWSLPPVEPLADTPIIVEAK